MPDDNANELLKKLQQAQQNDDEGGHDAGKLLDEAAADAAKREQLLIQMLASMSGGGIMSSLIGAIKSPWYQGLTPGSPNSLTSPTQSWQRPGPLEFGKTSDNVTPQGGYGGGGGYKGGGGDYGGGGASGDIPSGGPQMGARARTPYHDTHSWPGTGGRGRTPWHSTHPGISSGQTQIGTGDGGTGGLGGSVASQVINELRAQGFNENAIRGILANISDESKFNPSSRHHDQPRFTGEAAYAHGLYQFGGDQWNRYSAWLKQNAPNGKWQDPTLQTRYLAQELARSNLKERLNRGSAEQAAQAFVGGYEKPRADLRQQREQRYGRGVPQLGSYGPITPRGEGGEAPGGGRGGGFGAGRQQQPVSGGGGTGGNAIQATATGSHNQIQGTMVVNGHVYNFVSGGRGRGAAPYGEYTVGGLSKLPSYGIPGFPMSNKYDPVIKDTRSGLFIHPGGKASAGCLAIPRAQWSDFVRDMQAEGRHKLILSPNGKRYDSGAEPSSYNKGGAEPSFEQRVQMAQTGAGQSADARRKQEYTPYDYQRVSNETVFGKPTTSVLKTERPEGKGAFFGTAFAINPEYLVTAKHNVGDKNQIDVSFGGRKTTASVIHKSTDLDYAVLKLSPETASEYQKSGLTSLRVATETPQKGDPLTATGFPMTGKYSTIPGQYTRTIEGSILGEGSHGVRPPKGEVYEFVTDSKRNIDRRAHGLSGGPVVTKSDEAAGILTGGEKDHLISVPMSRILKDIPENMRTQMTTGKPYTTEDAIKDLHKQNEKFKENIEKRIEEQKKEGAKPQQEGGRPEDVKIHPSDSTATRLIKRFEAFSPKAYDDKSQTSIGYGSKARPGETSITEEEASKRVGEEMAPITSWLDSNITTKMTDNQRAGLTSFAYNEGTGALDRLKGDINSGNWDQVYKRMATWNKVTERGKKVFSKGIYARRLREIELMATPDGKVPENFAFGEKSFGTMGLPGASKVKHLNLPYNVQDKVDPFDTGGKKARRKEHAAHIGRRHAQATHHHHVSPHPGGHAAPHHRHRVPSHGIGHPHRQRYGGGGRTPRHHREEQQIASGDGGTLVFLHGIHDRYAGSSQEREAKREEIEKSVRAYATAHGYKDVKFVSGNLNQEQQQNELRHMIENDKSINGVFGFSQGGYAAFRSLNSLPPEHRGRIKQAIILGAPGTGNIDGVPTVNRGHMEGVGHMDMVQNWTSRQGTESGKPRPGGAEDVSGVGGRQVRSSAGRLYTTTPGDEFLAARAHIGGLSYGGALKEGYRHGASDITLNYAIRSMKPEMRYALTRALESYEKETGHRVNLASTYRSPQGGSSGLSSPKGSQHGKGYAADVGGKTWESVPEHGKEFLHYIDQHPEFGLSAKGLHGFKVPYGRGRSGPDVGHIEFSGSRGGKWGTWSQGQREEFYKSYRDWMKSGTPQPTEHPVTEEKKDQSRLTPEPAKHPFSDYQKRNRQIQDSAARHGALHQPPPPPADTVNKNPTVRGTNYTQRHPHEKRNTNLSPDWAHSHRHPSTAATSRVVGAYKKADDLRHDSFSTAGQSNA